MPMQTFVHFCASLSTLLRGAPWRGKGAVATSILEIPTEKLSKNKDEGKKHNLEFYSSPVWKNDKKTTVTAKKT